MNTATDGALECTGKDEILFRFEKDNFDAHCAKHLYLYNKLSWKRIESTLSNPDCITKGPPTEKTSNGKVKELWNKRTYYKVIGPGNNGGLYVCRVPVFIQSKKVYIIKTALLFSTSVMWSVNQKEICIWRKPGSKI